MAQMTRTSWKGDEVARHDRDQREIEGHLRNGEEELDAALDPVVGQPAEIAGYDADQRAEHHRHGDHDQRDRHGELAADEQPGEHVAAVAVGADDVPRAAGRRCEKMAVERHAEAACRTSRARESPAGIASSVSIFVTTAKVAGSISVVIGWVKGIRWKPSSAKKCSACGGV